MALQPVNRGIRQMKIAFRTAANTFSSVHLIKGARNMSLEAQVETDELRGDDVVLNRYTKVISALVTVEMGTLDLTAAYMFTGGSLASDDYYEDFVLGENDDPPTIALACRIKNAGSPGDTHILIPNATISGNIPFLAQVGSYMLPGAQFQGISDGDVNGIARIKNFSLPTALEIPLRNTVGGF